MDNIFQASCFCGAVQYALSAAPMFIHACHCRDCQVQTGGAFAINGIIEAEHVRLTKGKPVRVTMPTESGRPHDITRCAKCQTALWSDYGRRKVMLFVRMTTLKDARRFSPDVHIFTKSRLPCDELALSMGGGGTRTPRGKPKKKDQFAKDAPIAHTTVKGATTKKPAGVFSVYYDMQTEWPAASLKRREVCLAKMT